MFQKTRYSDGAKCYGCGWTASVKYAIKGVDIDEEGLCAECFIEVIEAFFGIFDAAADASK